MFCSFQRLNNGWVPVMAKCVARSDGIGFGKALTFKILLSGSRVLIKPLEEDFMPERSNLLESHSIREACRFSAYYSSTRDRCAALS
jgi:hypothetical protein